MYIANAIIIQRTTLWNAGAGYLCVSLSVGASLSDTNSEVTFCTYFQLCIRLCLVCVAFLRLIKKVEMWEMARESPDNMI